MSAAQEASIRRIVADVIAEQGNDEQRAEQAHADRVCAIALRARNGE